MERKEQWCCPECNNKRPKQGNINTPVRNISTFKESSQDGHTTVVTKQKLDDNITQRTKLRAQQSATVHTPTTRDHTNLEQLRDFMISELKLHLKARVSDLENSLPQNILALEDTITQLSSKISEQEQAFLSNDI
ncbi:unnamed protein product [Leptidea sinapis]|uniref:Uncharacterized protein n=1 Tax=Leptidea sinapis TaxID=189913 RepID=A0A5E4QHD3_9NEOP|nr:unnamed protein product [Leptidea sinapis]